MYQLSRPVGKKDNSIRLFLSGHMSWVKSMVF
jgi:hypothetical protein